MCTDDDDDGVDPSVRVILRDTLFDKLPRDIDLLALGEELSERLYPSRFDDIPEFPELNEFSRFCRVTSRVCEKNNQTLLSHGVEKL